MKKYELVKDLTIAHEGRTLYRIRALRGFLSGWLNVEPDTIGGWIESENNLSQAGTCWIQGESKVYDKAVVSGCSLVEGSSIVKDNALVRDQARVRDSVVYDHAVVEGDSSIRSMAQVYGHATLRGVACLLHGAHVCENAVVNNARVVDGVVKGDAIIDGSININEVTISGVAHITGHADFRSPYVDRDLIIIKGRNDWMTFGNVGSEYGVLTVYRADDALICTRGCFTGTVVDFMQAVRQEYGAGPIAQEYALMIQAAELRLRREPPSAEERDSPARRAADLGPATMSTPEEWDEA